MSSKNKTNNDASDLIDDPTLTTANAAAAPVYVSSLAAENTYRSYQWYLDGNSTEGGNAYGANVDQISTEYTGLGVRVGIIDQGFDISNIDLVGRFDLTDSYDPRDVVGTTNIAPDSSAESHGTMVAGVIGASATNHAGAVGVAPDSTMIGYYARFGLGGSSVSELAHLLAMQANVDVSNNSWGFSYAFSDNFQNPALAEIGNALAYGAEYGRHSLGTVYVFAAGNDRQYVHNSSTADGDNTNNHNLTNSRFVITAAASTEDGHIASFSAPGASILVTAPGDSIFTTTLGNGDGDATNDFAFMSGTSFAAPVVSGVVAIMLEANPDLGYRDVQEILTISSHKLDPASSSWATNGATNWNGGGNMVSNDFGFGLVDAHAAARLAETWTLHSTAANEQVISVSGDVSQNTLLSHSGPNAYVATVSGHEHFSIDWVELDITLQNARNGDLTIELISPDGTDSVLLDHPNGGTNAAANLNFTFSTNHNWGETPNGNWTVVVHDTGTNGTDSIVSYSLRIYGDDHGTNDTYFYTDDFATLSGDRSILSDAAGNDAINASAVTTDLTLDLNPGHTSIIAGRTVDISAGTVIESAYGGDGNDVIIGNDSNNYLYGGHGHNNLQGGAGDDTLNGGPDGSTLVGGIGNDTYDVRSSSDVVIENPNEGTDLAHVYISNYVLAANVENGVAELVTGQTLTGNDGDNWMLGNVGNDTLIGGLGSDSLNGGAGNDTMIGGLGNDQYVVDSVGDIIVEHPGEGIDAAYILVSGYTLADHVETGVIGLTTGATLTGNDGDNTLLGNNGNDTLIGGAGNDYLSGGAGADTMIGGTGNDIYMVDNVGDVIVEQPGEGTDYAYVSVSGYVAPDNVEVVVVTGTVGMSVTGGAGNSVLWGSPGDDTLTGHSGNDILFGGAGADTMIGGTGSDLYFVDNVGDQIIEHAGEGTDSAYVSVNGYTLADNVEVGVIESPDGLTLSGNANDNSMWGNTGNDTLIGGGGNDFLSSCGGADTLIGGTGSDVYVVYSANDVVIEAANEGIDTVYSLAHDYTLAANVEVGAILASDGATLRANDEGNTLWGRQGNDTLIGGAGNDVLNGSAGQDILTGGGGSDIFVFQFGESNGDVITDFSGHGGQGDELYFSGFGTAAQGAHFSQVDATHWEISSADGSAHELITFQNGATTTASDWHFV